MCLAANDSYELSHCLVDGKILIKETMSSKPRQQSRGGGVPLTPNHALNQTR